MKTTRDKQREQERRETGEVFAAAKHTLDVAHQIYDMNMTDEVYSSGAVEAQLNTLKVLVDELKWLAVYSKESRVVSG